MGAKKDWEGKVGGRKLGVEVRESGEIRENLRWSGGVWAKGRKEM